MSPVADEPLRRPTSAWPSRLTPDDRARALADWAYEPWVAGFLQESPTPMDGLTRADPDRRISPLGSRSLHLATMSVHRPYLDATVEVVRYLLVERGANPNLPDDHGRTPLIMFLTHGSSAWRENDALGCWVLDLFLEHGADVNVLFAPDFKHIAQCGRWTLAHHLADAHHGATRLPPGLRARLEPRLDRSIRDSAGRLPGPILASPR